MKNPFLDTILKIIQKDEVKSEIIKICKPIVMIILHEIYPYMFFTMAFILINFILLLGIFIILVRNKNKPFD
tara:strand:- start:538 stop:753 length:216 start_codon:yes stop_codon:yes gene_type:complete